MKLPFFLILLVIRASALNSNPEENVGVLNPNLFEGDMILTTSQRLAIKSGLDLNGVTISRGATANRFSLWSNGIVPYAIDSRLRARPTSDVWAGNNQSTWATAVGVKAL